MIWFATIILAMSLQSAEGLPPAEEARAQDLMREIRCMVCSGETILDSNAPMALDMRRFVREQVAAGRNDDEVRQALVDGYGHEVLMRPPLGLQTTFLWIAPLVLLGFGAALLMGSMRGPARRTRD